jgi:hypothetical protein
MTSSSRPWIQLFAAIAILRGLAGVGFALGVRAARRPTLH